jgi:hypothetical protein
MAHPGTQPMLSGWSPLAQPTPPPTIESLRRWLWPGTVLAAFAALVAYVVQTSPGPGISVRGWSPWPWSPWPGRDRPGRSDPAAPLGATGHASDPGRVRGGGCPGRAAGPGRRPRGRAADHRAPPGHRAGGDPAAGHPPGGRGRRLAARAVAARRPPGRPPHPAVNHPAHAHGRGNGVPAASPTPSAPSTWRSHP